MANSDYSRDYLNKARDLYLTNPTLNVSDIARLSSDLLGQPIDPDTLRLHAQKEGWAAQKARENFKPNMSITEEVNQIRQVVFRQIIAAEHGGVFVTGPQLSQAVELLKNAGLEVELLDLKPGGVDHNLVNAYMNLLAKSKININLDSVSAKTPRELAIELAKEALSEHRSGTLADTRDN